MYILIVVNPKELNCRIFNKSLFEFMLNRLSSKYTIGLYLNSKDKEINLGKYKDKLIKEKDLSKALNKISKEQKELMVITKLALCNVNIENLIQYHQGHQKKVTIVCKNLVKGKTISIFKLNSNKEIIEVNQKRYADTGIYLFKNIKDFSKCTNLFSLIKELIKQNEVKAFIHKGYWWTSRNIKRRNKNGYFKV